LTTVHTLNREISKHTPLISFTNNSSTTYQAQFKFELGWLLREGFEMVSQVWQNIVAIGSPMDVWLMKIRRHRQHFRGWAKHVSGVYKKIHFFTSLMN
jgi:hypothetical protein